MNRLVRSRTDRKIAGVCGGIAQANGWDPTIVRVVWLALVIFGGTGVLAYLALWIVMPEEPLALPPQSVYTPANYADAQHPYASSGVHQPVNPPYTGQDPTSRA